MFDKQGYVEDLIERLSEIYNELEQAAQLDLDFEFPFELSEQLLSEIEQLRDH